MVKIGNNNNVGDNNAIGENAKVEVKGSKSQKNHSKPQKWHEKHPWLFGIICSIIASFIFLFSFWKDVISFIEGLFG